VEYLGDIPAILDRYQKFIEANKGTSAAREAERDVALWTERRDQGYVKAAGKWLTPDERSKLQEQSIQVVEQARQLIKDNRLKDAESVLNKALADDPQNASALYLKGLVLFRQDQLLPARKAFEAANPLAPNHAPALNNLAVVNWRQNQFIAALNFYDQAMLASPGNKVVLDNLAEALAALPKEYRNHFVTLRASHHFAEQDSKLQQQMAQQGQFRWGSAWVSQQDLEKLKAAEKEIKDKLDSMAADYDQAQARIVALDRNIADNDRSLRQMEMTQYARDPNTGQTLVLPLPPSYYAILRENDTLKTERQTLLAKLETLKQQAKSSQQRLPTPRFTGIQQVIGVEGTPLVPVGMAAAAQSSAAGAITPLPMPNPKPEPAPGKPDPAPPTQPKPGPAPAKPDQPPAEPPKPQPAPGKPEPAPPTPAKPRPAPTPKPAGEVNDGPAYR
jgi:Flp pilus assembly protein TadD